MKTMELQSYTLDFIRVTLQQDIIRRIQAASQIFLRK